MPPSQNESPSSRASLQSPRTDLDSPISGGNAWVDVQPPVTPGSQGQQRRRASSVWSDHSLSVSEYLTDFDNVTDTSHEPSRPVTPAAQKNEPGPASNNQDSINMTQPQTQPPQPRPSWTWRTLLLLDDEQTEALELDSCGCAAITIHEEDTASFAALRAKVLATLRRMVLHSSRSAAAAAAGLSRLDSEPGMDMYISWNLPPPPPLLLRSYHRLGRADAWGLAHVTRVSPLDGRGEEREGEGEAGRRGRRRLDDVAWMRENMEAAALGLGDALLVVRLGWAGIGDEGDEDYAEDGCSVASSGGMGCGEDEGEEEEALEVNMEASHAVCSSAGFFDLQEY
ncbi:hypothetical protein VMCG_09566 [Cytospora schulzeri]|uniref:Uncharacterized protein n=1 Tax=Cytospora schulzeri TaxID=448051 RepID=A0A423VLY6_9PEZI|nr:hypothetical protein VMCG_09566 [Valsa malicola]